MTYQGPVHQHITNALKINQTWIEMSVFPSAHQSSPQPCHSQPTEGCTTVLSCAGEVACYLYIWLEFFFFMQIKQFINLFWFLTNSILHKNNCFAFLLFIFYKCYLIYARFEDCFMRETMTHSIRRWTLISPMNEQK